MVYLLDKAGEQIYLDWYNSSVDEYGGCSVQAKLDYYLPRLALVIDILQKVEDDNTGNIIYPTSVQKAVTLVEYFRFNADRVNKIIEHGVSPLEKLSKKYQNLYHDLPSEFTVKNERKIFTHHNVIGDTSIYNFLGKRKLFIKVEHKIWRKKL